MSPATLDPPLAAGEPRCSEHTNTAPTMLSIVELRQQCSEELSRFRNRDQHNGRFSFELFRRAICEGDDAAWTGLLELYSEQVAAWCRRAGARSTDDVDELVACAWERFWQYYTPATLAAASGLPSVLRYLSLCAASVVIDSGRRRWVTLRLEEIEGYVAADRESPLEQVISSDAGAELCGLIERHLHDEREHVLFWLRYGLGLRPAVIHASRPDLFPTVQDVYRITRNVLDRMSRCPELRRWYDHS